MNKRGKRGYIRTETVPTQAQIEAAQLREALEEMLEWADSAFKPVIKARAALTAAAEVGEQRACATCHAILSDGPQPASCYAATDPALRDFIKDTPLSEPNDGWATEEQGDGLPLKYTDKDLDDVVERCAQVAENWSSTWPTSEAARAIAAAIRALKDKERP